jgi:hypothetical protein
MMNQQDRFSEIFNECLDRLLKGEPINQLLAQYPDQAKELEPLLRTAAATRAFSKVQPGADFKARARYEFLSAARELETQPKQRSFFKWRWQPAWAISLTAAVVVVLAGGGTVAASNGSMPGEALYSIKLATEKVQLVFTPSDVVKTELNAKFANRRAEEIEYLAVAGDTEQIQMATVRLNSSLSNMSVLAQDDNPASNSAGVEQPRAYSFNAVATPAENASPAMKFAPALNDSDVQPSSTEPSDSVVTPTPETRVPAPVAMSPQSAAGAGNTMTAENATNLVDNNQTAMAVPNSSNVSNQSNNTNTSNSNKLSKKDKMRKIIDDNYQARKTRLEAALEKAKPELRPAIRQAIADSESEYWKLIQNLDQGLFQNSNLNTNQGTKENK